MVASDSKTAEFARLFDLFERLASRKSRTLAMEDTQSPSVPADLAPVVNRLAGLVGNRKHEGDARQKKLGGRARRNTVAALGVVSREPAAIDEDEESLEKFPLGKKYPFTFKMMLYKLYQLDDWAQKVKEVLEKSQIEYKPLAEKDEGEQIEGPTSGDLVQEGRVHFKAGVAGPRRPIRPRSHSVSVFGLGRDAGPIMTSPKSPNFRTAIEEDKRAVKKRCVGRRKSIGGPLSSDVGRVGGVGGWIYDAAISSAESTGRRETSEFVAPVYPSVGNGMRSIRGTRRVSLGNLGKFAQQGVEGGTAVRKRALSVMDSLTPVHAQRKQMKRAFEC